MAKHNQTGWIGERTVAAYLRDQKFTILERNYRRKWGELDLVAAGQGVIHFIEIKTAGYIDSAKPGRGPAERVDNRKLDRIARIIQTYATENRISLEKDRWQFDLYVVYLDHDTKEASLEVWENVLVPGR